MITSWSSTVRVMRMLNNATTAIRISSPTAMLKILMPMVMRMVGSNRRHAGRFLPAGRHDDRADYSRATRLRENGIKPMRRNEAGRPHYRGGYGGGPYRRYNSCRFKSREPALLDAPGGG